MTLHADDYTVAWICALPLEMAAAKIMLDSTQSPLPQSVNDNNNYTFGRIGGHNVVLACLPAGVYGTISASTVVSQMRCTFRNIQFGLMVGIGGGVPSRAADIRLGDIVVSKPVGTSSGVIQYDYGESVRDGSFQRTGMLNKPPQILLTAVSQMDSNDMLGKSQIMNTISSALKSHREDGKQNRTQFARPSNDWLFHPLYDHPDGAPDCSTCDQRQLVQRTPRATNEPHIHYGLIASGGQVMKNAKTRDSIAKDLNVLCFEMEAAGIMDRLPSLVIRGICDYCDSHNHKEWQGYAALTAAAYARELLLVIPVYSHINSVHAPPISNDNNPTNPPCLQALQCPNPFTIKNRLKETKDKLLFEAIEWIFHDPQYCSWQTEAKTRLLWIKGGAGKGKTMMSIGLIEQISQDDSSLLTYFFCQNADHELNSIEAVIKGLIWQLLQQQAQLIFPLQQRWDTAHSRFKEKISWRILWDVFLEMLSQCKHQRVYVFIDALDECQNQGMAELLRLIVRAGHDHANIKWLLTSRPLDSAEQELLATAEQVEIGLDLNSDYLDAAIKRYISHKVGELYPCHQYGSQVPLTIASELLKRAGGTFLWVSLVCQRLESENVPLAEAISIIRDLPPGLDLFYERIFSQIIEGQSATVTACLRLLRAMMLAYRPLERAELASVTGLGLSDAEAVSGTLINRCASFIKLRGGVVEFVHQSSRDFLAQPSLHRAFDNYGHGDVALSCLAFLSTRLKVNLIDLPLPNSTRPIAIEEVADPNGKQGVLRSVKYAATFWAEHLEAASNTELTQRALGEGGQVMSFLCKNLLEWLECLSLLDQLSHAIKALQILSTLAQDSKLQSTISDATRFLLHYQAISDWPLQIYSSSIAFSPEKSLARMHSIGKAAVWLKRMPLVEKTWDPLIQTLAGHTKRLTAIAFSPDGQHLASASADQTICLWDARTGEHQKTLAGHTKWVTAIVFSPDGQHLVSASADQTIRLWDTRTGEHQKTLSGHTRAVTAVAFSPDSQHLASASDDQTICLWDARTGKHEKTITGHTGSVIAVTFSPDSQHLASASDDQTICLWDARTGEHQKTLAGHTRAVTAVAFSPDSQHLASTSYDRTVRLWDTCTGGHQETPAGHTAYIRAVAFSPDGQHLALASDDRTIRLWDACTGEHKTLSSYTGIITAVALSPDGQHLASASNDGTICLWDTRTGEDQEALTGHTAYIRAVAFSPGSQYLASASDDETIYLWNARTGEHQKTLASHTDYIRTVAFSADSQHLTTTSDDRTIYLWDTHTGEHQKTLAGHTDDITAVAFSPDGQRLASASDDGTIRLWDAHTGEHQKTLAGHISAVTAVAFSPDSQHLASASNDGAIRLWDAHTGEHQKTLAGHTNAVTAVAFSPDGQHLASASYDQTVRLWDVKASLRLKKYLGSSLAALKNFRKSYRQIEISAPTTTLSFSEDGSFLKTDIGHIKVGITGSKGGGLSLSDGWICYGLQPILRIPTRFQISCYAAQGDDIAIGCKDGRVISLSFDCRILDQILALSTIKEKI